MQSLKRKTPSRRSYSYPQLDIVFQPSKYHCAFIGLIALMAALFVTNVSTDMPAELSFKLSMLMLLFGVTFFTVKGLRSQHQVTGVRFQRGDWFLRVNKQWLPGHLHRSSVMTARLLLLRWIVDSKPTLSHVILADSCDADSLRKLRVTLLQSMQVEKQP